VWMLKLSSGPSSRDKPAKRDSAVWPASIGVVAERNVADGVARVTIFVTKPVRNSA
jgi:hypothetical protein